jgi:integrase/recombinase XerD
VYAHLFTRDRAIHRYLTAPLLDERLGYLTHCAAQGMARATLRAIAWHQLATLRLLDVQSGASIRQEQIEAAAKRWASRRPAPPTRTSALASRISFRAHATHWLRFLGRLQAPAPPTPPWAAYVAAFAAYMRDERGLSPLTIYTRCKRAAEFLGRLERTGGTLPELTLAQVDAAITEKGTQDGCTRVTVRTYAYVLRAFLRYAEGRRWCRPGLAAGLLPPRVYRQEGVPAGPTWPEVEQLCAAAGGNTAADIRDHAALLLFAVYGFRVGEVRRLRLDDLDWQAEVVRVRRSKPHPRVQCYPLSPRVGEALLRYLTTVRPRCAYREVFLSLKAPVHPLGNSALWQLVHRRLQPFGFPLRHQGPHALRHAAATRLLAGGFSMKTIGDYLGHRSPAATRVYAKVDLAGLRQVADFPLEGLR